MSLRERKKMETAARILDVSQRLFLDSGYGSTSIVDIAAAAGVSRASLFNYYNGKPAIIEALAARLEPRLVQMVSHYLSKPLTTDQRIEALFAYLAKVVDQTIELTRLLLAQGSSAADFPLLRQALVQLVERGQRSGEVRDDFAAEQVAEPLYLAFVASLLGWARPGGMTAAQQFAQRADYLCAQLKK
jgi:AcrR family transcriptional regulator